MTNLKNFFETKQTNNTAISSSARTLAGTAQLTNVANELASEMLKALSDNLETYGELGRQSKTDHAAMDKLISSVLDLEHRDLSMVDFLRELPSDTLDGMLKSQQSKRSRAKGKIMTEENYVSMLVGAISENLIRLVYNKPKTGGQGAHRQSATVEYSEQDMQKFADDPDALKREIRNIQSKKSIMRTKVGFDESDPRYVSLLVAEADLKALRDNLPTDTVREKLESVIGEVDVTQLKGAEAKEMLAKLLEVIKA